MTLLIITFPCKPASTSCSKCNQRQCYPTSASSHANCAQPCCREISFKKLLLLIQLSQMHHREKGFTVLHPLTHQKLISALPQVEILCSHPSTPSTGPLVHWCVSLCISPISCRFTTGLPRPCQHGQDGREANQSKAPWQTKHSLVFPAAHL